MDRAQLAEFLRSRRARVTPADVGLRGGQRRRTPGLRREEVAQLAAISVDYYTRLEQRRSPRPSRQVLAALGRALRLSDDERRHLFHLAGEVPAPKACPNTDVPTGVLHLLDRLDDTPAMVFDHRYDLVAWNAMASALFGGLDDMLARWRNVTRRRFLPNPEMGVDMVIDEEQRDQIGREIVADLRSASARHPSDESLTALIAELSEGSDEFRRLWAEHEVGIVRTMRKRLRHPVVGELDLECQSLVIPEREQRMVVYTAAPGTPSHAALQLLRVVGVQNMSPAAP